MNASSCPPPTADANGIAALPAPHVPTPRVCAFLRLRGEHQVSSSSYPGASGLRTPATSTVSAGGPGAFSPSRSAPCLSRFPLLRMRTVGATRRCGYPTRM
eukprot:1033876-Pleurochrysis_carterae.AAC.1